MRFSHQNTKLSASTIHRKNLILKRRKKKLSMHMRKNYLTSHALKGEQKMPKMDITKRKKDTQTKYNILVSILYQFITAAVGLVLPRFILSSYGSEINGIVQSVNQFLSYRTRIGYLPGDKRGAHRS